MIVISTAARRKNFSSPVAGATGCWAKVAIRLPPDVEKRAYAQLWIKDTRQKRGRVRQRTRSADRTAFVMATFHPLETLALRSAFDPKRTLATRLPASSR